MRHESIVRRTPLVRASQPDWSARELHFKLENVQRTGSFKLRGAVARLLHLTSDEKRGGVVTSSAGNHGAGVALAARSMGVAATIVVPRSTPAIKQNRIASFGADILVSGATYDEAETTARQLAREQKRLFVSPFDDEHVIEGNGGGVADELLIAAPDLSMVICPVGGGGLIGGLARRLAPRGVRVVGAQPENNCAMFESLRQNRALTTYEGRPTLAEGCEGAVAERTFALSRQYVEEIVLVSEESIQRAVAVAYRALGAVIECSAAVALAPFLDDRIEPASTGTTVVVLTGGNIEPTLLDQILRKF